LKNSKRGAVMGEKKWGNRAKKAYAATWDGDKIFGG